MMLRKILLFAITLVLTINLVSAFDIGIQQYAKNSPDHIDISQEMIGNDLELDVAMNFAVHINYSQLYNNLTIYFEPFETLSGKPVIIKNVTICKGSTSGMNSDEVFIRCAKKFSIITEKSESNKNGYLVDGKYYLADYYNYIFLFFPEDNERYVIRIVALYPNYAKKEELLYSLPLRYPDREKFTDVSNFFIFPKKSSVPIFLPDNIRRIREHVYFVGEQAFSRLAYEFENMEDMVIFYQDQEDIKKRDVDLVMLGVFLGFLFSIILFIFDIIFGDYLRRKLGNLRERLIEENATSALVLKNKYFERLSFLKQIKRNRKKIRELYIGFIAGLFAGLPVGFIFAEIKPGNYLHNAVISSVALVIFVLLFLAGKTIVKTIFTNKEIFNYYTNFLAGMVSSAAIAFLIKAKGNFTLSIIVTAFIVILYLILAYNHTKAKRT